MPTAKPGDKKVPFGSYLRVGLQKRLNRYSEASGIPITRILEDALTAYLDRKGGDRGE